MPFTVADLAELVSGAAEGDGARVITGANTIESAGPADLAFAANRKALDAAVLSNAGCLLVPVGLRPIHDDERKREDIPGFAPAPPPNESSRRVPSVSLPSRPGFFNAAAVIRVSDPRAAFAKALEVIYPRKRLPPGVHPSALVAASAELGSNCHVGAYVTIGDQARIGDGCQISTGCVLGDSVEIGNGSTLHARVTIYDRVKIGARVIVHSGCVIGADGFGFVLDGDHYEKFPQVGVVEIGDDVEIGANCCIDRAALGSTRVGNGTKIDNLVHIAHNCSIGRHVIVVAQTGFSGSVTVGDYAVIGGQVGVGEKAKIESKAIIGGKAGVLTSQTVHAGEPVWGIPARPLRRHLKGLAYVQKLPELNELVRELRQRVTDLESKRTRS